MIRTFGPLDGVSYEVFPSARIVDDIAQHLPWGADVSVTVSPTSGIKPTVCVASELNRLGFAVTAHVAARMFASESEAVEAAQSLQGAGVHSALLLAGDQDAPLGPLDGAWELYRTLAEHHACFDRMFFAAYPQGHPRLRGAAAEADLITKSKVADGFVSQMCLSPGAVSSWVSGLRAKGVDVPIRIGVSGPVLMSRLRKVSRRLGVAMGGALAGGDRDSSDIYDLTSFVEDLNGERGTLPSATSLHIYTFNDVARARNWVDTR